MITQELDIMSKKKRYTVPSFSVIAIETEGLLADSNFVTPTIIFIGLCSDDDENIDPEDAL